MANICHLVARFVYVCGRGLSCQNLRCYLFFQSFWCVMFVSERCPAQTARFIQCFTKAGRRCWRCVNFVWAAMYGALTWSWANGSCAHHSPSCKITLQCSHRTRGTLLRITNSTLPVKYCTLLSLDFCSCTQKFQCMWYSYCFCSDAYVLRVRILSKLKKSTPTV